MVMERRAHTKGSFYSMFLAMLTVMICQAAVFGQVLIVVDQPDVILRPVPVPTPPPTTTANPLRLDSHRIEVTVKGQVATTDVEQVFYNTSGQRVEGTYLFPVPIDAKIDKFTMDINGKQQEAELLDADKARTIYENIVRSMRDPALMEYAGQRLFKVRVFPIEPNSKKTLTLRYTQLLRKDAGVVGYTYPLGADRFAPGSVGGVSIKVSLENQGGLANVYSPSHKVEVKQHGSDEAVVGYEERNMATPVDFQLFFSPVDKADEQVGVSLLAYHDKQDKEGGYFMLLASPTWQAAKNKAVSQDVIFVMDTSGSMAGEKLEQAKAALKFCIENLNKGDRFDIVRFSTEAEPMFGSLSPLNDSNKTKAFDFINNLKPIGGTAIYDALHTALKMSEDATDADKRPCNIIFLTDGKPTVGQTDEEAIVQSVSTVIGRQPRVRTPRVFCFGVGNELNTHLLDKVTEATRAVSQYVVPGEDIEVKVSSFYSKLSSPVLTALSLDFKGVRVSKVFPGDLPDMFKGEQLIVTGRYTGDGDVTVTLAGNMNGVKEQYVYELKLPGDDVTRDFVPRLWAQRRVGYLLDEIRLHGESAELRDEVTLLARQYGIVTPYTAYLIVEDESRRNVPVAARTLQSLEGDVSARRDAGRAWEEMNTSKSGAAALDAANANLALKSAATPSAPATSQPMAEFYAQGGQGQLGERAGVKKLQEQQVKFVRGRAFYQNGDEWIDSNVANQTDAKRVEVKLNSDEYFKLANAHKDAAAWLSVGQNVQLLIDDTVYVVR
ncbi:MAG: VWA domain-containing protein [Phycisphaera sp.]|nr:VWA domain-containing protein [Phycisphaera sp.]